MTQKSDNLCLSNLAGTAGFEPISSTMLAESCRLSPNACPSKPALVPPEKPFALFFEISFAEFLFSCKGYFLAVRLPFHGRGVDILRVQESCLTVKNNL